MILHHNPHVIYFMIASLWDDQYFHLARHLYGVDTCLQHLLRFVLPKSLPVSPALPASLPGLHLDFARVACKCQAATCVNANFHKYHLRVCDT